MDLSFTVQKLAKFSSNLGKVHFEILVNLLRFIRENNNLALKYYANMEDAPLSDRSRQDNIKTENQLIAFSGSGWQDFPYTDRSTGSYIIFYQGGPIENITHVPGLISQ